MIKNLLLIVLSFFIVGCAGKYSEPNADNTAIKKSNKAYIELFRKDQFFAGGVNIYAYEVKDGKIIPIIALANNQRFIYEVDKGNHKIYTTLFNIIEINAEENKTYHVDILPNNKYRFYALIVEENQDINNAINELKTNGCKENILNKYNFVKRESDYKSQISLIVTCENEKLTNYEDMKSTLSISEINKIPTVKMSPSGKDFFNSELENETKNFNEYYPFWESKLKNIPLINEPFIKFNKYPGNENIKKYNGINITSSSKQDFINDITSEFKDYKGNDKLDVEIIVKKHNNGNFLKRDSTILLNSANHYDSIGVIEVEVNYFDKSNKIASFNINSSVDGSGLIFDKFNTNESKIIKEIKNYTINNFIK